MQKKFTLTALQITPEFLIADGDLVKYAAKGDTDNYVLRAEARVTDGSENWFTMQVVKDGVIYTAKEGIRAIRFNLASLGTSVEIDIEINSTKKTGI